jgi:DNA-3-methyladenine glycosylase I
MLHGAPRDPERCGNHARTCRCAWSTVFTGAGHADYIAYHDTEWGLPQLDDAALFEHLVLDGAQCGLSWSTILARRPMYRRAFKEYNIAAVAGMVRAQLLKSGILNRALASR